MNTTRTGKIARLPKAVRDELNQRLVNGEPGTELVAWLNSLPEVQHVIAEQFRRKPVRAQNVSEWKQGGYQDWLNKQEAMEAVRHLPAGAKQLQGPNGEPFNEILGTWLTAHYATVAYDLRKKGKLDWKRVQRMCRDVSALRRVDHNAARLKLEMEKLEHARQQTEAEMIAQFVRWVKDPKIQDLLRKHGIGKEQNVEEPQMGTERREVGQRVNEPVGQTLSPVAQVAVRRRGRMTRGRSLYTSQRGSNLVGSGLREITTHPSPSVARSGQRALSCALESPEAAKSSEAQVGRGVLTAPGLERTFYTAQTENGNQSG